MKADFHKMPRKELLAYCKEHRDDDEAWGIYLDRRSPDETATWYSFPLTEEGNKQMEQVFRQKIQEIENKRNAAE